MKGLIVDSSLLIVKRLEEMLLVADRTKNGHSADSYFAGSGIFESRKPDLLLLGFSSPEEKSITFLSSIKTLNKTSKMSFGEIPAIIKLIADK
jgi:chemotaxis response regulator CheB